MDIYTTAQLADGPIVINIYTAAKLRDGPITMDIYTAAELTGGPIVIDIYTAVKLTGGPITMDIYYSEIGEWAHSSAKMSISYMILYIIYWAKSQYMCRYNHI